MPSPFVELEIGSRTVKVTNPDKVYFPARGETKLDLVNYFVAVGDGIVRALFERPCQLKRQPEGVGGEVIWQKRVPQKRPDWIETARVTFPSGRHADELCVTEVAHVAWAANLATLEFGAWPSRRRDPEKPDELRIDIDPQPGTAFAEAKQVAAVVRGLLDYNQNARDRTILSAYSVRGRPDATVSAPVTWDELPDVEPEDFTIASLPPRFAKLGDLHDGID